MDNENKWEYDYSSQDKNESGDTGYPNVGSSGMNTANQYNDPQPEPETAYTAPQTDNGAGGATPPVHPVQPQDAQPPKKKKKFNGKRVARSAVALVLAAAMGFAGGFVGAKFGGSGKVVIQQVAPSSTADSASGSDNSITAASRPLNRWLIWSAPAWWSSLRSRWSTLSGRGTARIRWRAVPAAA